MINKRGISFVNIIGIIGAILIFIGVAWLIAKNWHEIFLNFSTLGFFVSGFFLRKNKYETDGRALITLGVLLYVLSLFLISQIFNMPSNINNYAFLLFLGWTLIFITAYFLSSPENLVLSMILFFSGQF